MQIQNNVQCYLNLYKGGRMKAQYTWATEGNGESFVMTTGKSELLLSSATNWDMAELRLSPLETFSIHLWKVNC